MIFSIFVVPSNNPAHIFIIILFLKINFIYWGENKEVIFLGYSFKKFRFVMDLWVKSSMETSFPLGFSLERGQVFLSLVDIFLRFVGFFPGSFDAERSLSSCHALQYSKGLSDGPQLYEIQSRLALH